MPVKSDNILRQSKAVVLNSSHPELDQLAAELASRGGLRQYFGRYFPDGRAWERLLEENQATRGLFLSGPGRRRLLPDLQRTERHEAGVFWDFASGLPRRLFGQRGEGMYRAMQDRRDQAIVRSALRFWNPNDPILANFSVAQEVFERAEQHGTLRVLNYPIAHHEYTRKLLAEEAELQPEFAADLIGQTPHPALAKKLDRECALATKIIVGSNFVKQSFVENGIAADKLFVALYGVSLEDFLTAETPSEARTGHDVFRAAWVGQVSQRKGIKYLLKAWQSVRGPKMELVIAGHFMSNPAVMQPYEELFRRVGFLDVPGLQRLFRDSDVLVLPSLLEGLGLVVLQAMAAGLPVIVTPHGPGDLVRDGIDGFVVPIRDSSAIAEKLQLLRDEPELRAEMGRNARLRAQEFTWQRFRNEAADFVESLLA